MLVGPAERDHERVDAGTPQLRAYACGDAERVLVGVREVEGDARRDIGEQVLAKCRRGWLRDQDGVHRNPEPSGVDRGGQHVVGAVGAEGDHRAAAALQRLAEKKLQLADLVATVRPCRDVITLHPERVQAEGLGKLGFRSNGRRPFAELDATQAGSPRVAEGERGERHGRGSPSASGARTRSILPFPRKSAARRPSPCECRGSPGGCSACRSEHRAWRAPRRRAAAAHSSSPACSARTGPRSSRRTPGR